MRSYADAEELLAAGADKVGVNSAALARPALLSELSNARSEGGRLVHLRLSISAFELGLLPFEAAVAPDGFPGSGSPLFLQSRTPITLTREIRRGQPLGIQWNRKLRILYAFATPDGLPRVPAQAHLQAIRRALDPWVKVRDDPECRLEEIKSMLTVMPNASDRIEKILIVRFMEIS